ncbi:MAG: hypothetical protein VYD19_10075, partial [Myxococcota bacterium]|nr:hypothetical protein [Myxococcota bacterium]
MSRELSETVSVIMADAQALEGAAQLDFSLDALGQLKSASEPQQYAELYLALVQENTLAPQLFWRLVEAGFASEALPLIRTQLSAEGETHPSSEAHALVIGAVMGEERGVDMKLRELAGRDPEAGVWQRLRFAQSGKWRNIQQSFVESVGGDPMSARAEAARLAAEFCASLGAPAQVEADFWRQVYQSDRENLAAQEALIRLYPQLNKWKEYAELYKKYLEQLDDGDEEKQRGLRELIQVYQEKLNSEQQLAALYEQLFQIDPSDQEVALALQARLAKQRKWPILIDVLNQRLAYATELEDQVAIQLEIAQTYGTQMRRAGEAQESYEALLDLDPSNETALAELSAIYEKTRDWERWLSVGQRRLSLLDDVAQLEEYKTLAKHADKKIRQPALSLQLWEAALALAPDDIDALLALADLYEQGKEWSRFSEILDTLVEVSTPNAKLFTLLQKGAQITQDQLGDVERAQALWLQLVELDPENKRAQDSLKKSLISSGSWDQLQDLLGAQERWEELVKVFESQVNSQPETSLKIELLFRAATLWEEALSQSDRSARALEKVLQLDPQNGEAARRLEPIYQAADNAAKLAGVLEVIVADEAPGAQRGSLMLRLAELYGERLRKPNDSFEWTRQWLAEDTAGPEVWQALERRGALLSPPRWDEIRDELLSVLDRLDANSSDEDRCALLLQLARITDEEQRDAAGALELYRSALELDQTEATALDALERLYQAAEAWPEVLEVLEQKLALAVDPETEKRHLEESARILEERLGDAAQSIETWERLLALDESHAEALNALHRLHAQEANFDALYEVIGRELALAQDELVKRDFTMQLCQLELESLDQPGRAVERLRDLLEEDPNFGPAKALLVQILDEPNHRLEAAQLLSPLQETAGEWVELSRSLEIQLQEAVEPALRITLLERLGAIHQEALQDPEGAFNSWARLLQEQPAHEQAFTSLIGLAEALGTPAWEQLAQLFEETTMELVESEQQCARLAQLAEIYEHQLAQSEAAIETWRRLLDQSDELTRPLEELARLYEQSQAWNELLEILQRQIERGDEAERIALLSRSAEIYEQLLDAPSEAINTHRELLALAPTQRTSLEALMRLYQREGLWVELTEAGELLKAQLTEPSARLSLELELGEIYRIQLSRAADALDCYQQVLAEEPAHPTVTVALEALLDEPQYQVRAASMLQPIFEAASEREGLVRVLEIQALGSSEVEERVRFLHLTAEQYLSAGDLGAAFERYAAALRELPNEEETLQALERIAEAVDGWGQLVDLFEEVVPSIEDSASQVLARRRVAKIYVDDLNSPAQAVVHYEAIFELESADASVLDALEQLYIELNEWEKLIDLLQHRRAQSEDVESRKAFSWRICELYESALGDVDSALQVYQEISDLDPNDLQSLESQERLFIAQERWPEVVEVLKRRELLMEAVEEKKAIYFLVASIYEDDRLDDLKRGVESYQRILGWDEEDRNALDRISELYRRLESWSDYQATLKRLAELSTEAHEIEAIAYRLAYLQERYFDAPLSAVEGYREILLKNPHHAESLNALITMIQEARAVEAAAGVLDEVLRMSAQWEGLIQSLQVLLEVTDEADQRAEVWSKIGAIQQQELASPHEAFESFATALQEAPEREETHQTLLSLCESLGLWPRLVDVLEAAQHQSDEAAVQIRLLLSAAEILEFRLGDSPRAIDFLLICRQVDERDRESLERLTRLYEQQGDASALAEILRTRIDLLREARLEQAEESGSADLTEGAEEEGAEEEAADATADTTLFGEEEADETLFGEDEEDATSVLAEEDETSALTEEDETSVLAEGDETS